MQPVVKGSSAVEKGVMIEKKASHGPQNIEEAFFSIVTPFSTADDPFTTGCIILSKFRFWSLFVFPPFF